MRHTASICTYREQCNWPLNFVSHFWGALQNVAFANRILQLAIDLSLFHPVARSYRRSCVGEWKTPAAKSPDRMVE